MSDQRDANPSAPSEPDRSRVSSPVPDHELIRLIGEGSYGEVWLARNTLGAYRAIKIVHEKSFRHKKPFEREFNGVQKFEPVSRLHEGLMDVLHVGRNDTAGYFYCVMELADDVVSGPVIDPDHYTPRTLAQDLARQKRLRIADCRRIGVAVASALDFLHERGLIHRDVKPSNIVFINGAPRLADIGLVAETTDARSYVGTDGFIPPEGPGTVQADLYSFGKVLYEISTGKDRHDYPEFPAELSDATEREELFEFNKIVLKSCRTDPRQRYKTAAEMAIDLVALAGEGDEAARAFVRRSRMTRTKSLAVVGVGLVAMILLWTKEKTEPPNPPHFSGLVGAATVKETVESDAAPLGLVSRWHGENSTGDAMGRNNGIMAGTNGVSYGPGMVGQAFVFDGTHRDRVDLGNPPSLRFQDFTIEAWIKRSNPTNISLDNRGRDGSVCGEGGCIFSYGTGGYSLIMLDQGQIILGRMDMDAVFSTGTVTDTNWHHVAVSKSGTNVVFYIDGTPEAAPVYKHPFDYTFKTSVAIGSRGDADGGTFYGLIDEVSIYDRALSGTQIRALYHVESTWKDSRPRTPVRNGLVSCWEAEGDPGDMIGGNNGTEHGSIKYVPGVVGSAFSFNGDDSYVEVPDNPLLNPTNAITVACWFNRRASVGNYDQLLIRPGLLSKVSSGYTLEFLANKIVFCVCNGTQVRTETEDLEFGRWYHVAGVYEGTRVMCYVNGKLVGQPVAATNALAPTIASLYLGWNKAYPDRYFNGLMDEVCVYNRALSASEIQSIYDAGSDTNSPAARPVAAP